MIKNVIEKVGGLDVYALTSLLLFVAVFIGALAWTCIQRASFCRKMESLPLEDESAPQQKEKSL